MVFDVVYDGLMEIDNWLEASSKHIAAGKEGPLDGFGGRYPLVKYVIFTPLKLTLVYSIL